MGINTYHKLSRIINTQTKHAMSNSNPKTDHLEATKWKSGDCPNPNGRPKKFTTALIEGGYTHSEILKVFHELAWMSKREINLLLEDDTQPAIVLIIARVFRIANPDGYLPRHHFQYVAEIFKYLMNKPPQLIATQSHIIHSKATDVTAPSSEPKNE